jgi:hypothetical protein
MIIAYHDVSCHGSGFSSLATYDDQIDDAEHPK